MDPQTKYSRKVLVVLTLFAALVRAFLAWKLELGNDEAYYYTYALYPDWSHFDHPPMVGWMIQLFSLDLFFDREFFLRLSSILLGTAGTWLIYQTGFLFGGPRTAFYTALLYLSSLYTSIIAGVFILPDTPQVFFWLLSLYGFSRALLPEMPAAREDRYLMLAGFSTALGVLSKYTSLVLWAGVALFILIYRRQWLSRFSLLVSLLLTCLGIVPVFLWNLDHDFISFTYQGGRMTGLDIRPDLFFIELLGEFFYNNPVNVVLIVMAGAAAWRRRVRHPLIPLLLLIALPLILVFWFLSWFNPTLPHWTGPAYLTLLPLAALHLSQARIPVRDRLVPSALRLALVIFFFVTGIGYLQVNHGLITRVMVPGGSREQGGWDVSLDMYGWRQMEQAMPGIYARDLAAGRIGGEPVLLSWRWFPAANIDYYVGRRMDWKLYASGDLERIHKYYWINRQRGQIVPGTDAYFICSDRDKKDPGTVYRDLFRWIGQPDTVPVYRGGKQVYRFLVYPLRDFSGDIRSFSADPPIR